MAFAILGGKCSTCGTADDLQIDHVDPALKKIKLGKMWSIAEDRYLSELRKCQLLCGEHHRQKSRTEQSVPHGGGVAGKRNCRCAECAPLKNAYQKRYRGRAVNSIGRIADL